MKAKPGDWIAFQRESRIVIGEIAYAQERTGGWTYYVTNAGEVREDFVLEVRAKKEAS